MKFPYPTLALCFLFALVRADDDGSEVDIKTKCVDETGIDAESMERLKNSDYSVANEQSMKFAVCIMRSIGGLNEDDTINVRGLSAAVVDEQSLFVVSVAETCKKLQGDDVNTKVWNFLKCYLEHRPDKNEATSN